MAIFMAPQHNRNGLACCPKLHPKETLRRPFISKKIFYVHLTYFMFVFKWLEPPLCRLAKAQRLLLGGSILEIISTTLEGSELSLK